MIQHQPFGIDDPYKHLPTERFPRDPVSGQAVQLTFATDPSVKEAWVTLEGEGETRRYEAQFLGSGLWSAQLPPLAAGNYRYTLHTEAGEATDPYPLPIGEWHTVDRVIAVNERDTGIEVVLEDATGQRSYATLSLSATGACLLEFSLEPSGEPDGQHHLASNNTDGWISADGSLKLSLGEESLELTVQHPKSGASVQTSLRFSYLVLPNGRVTRFEVSYPLSKDEELYGLGERFTAPGLRGKCWDVRVYEEYKEQGARTYIPLPYFVSSEAWGLWVETDAPSAFDARGDTLTVTVEADSDKAALRQHLIVADTPYGVTQTYTKLTGDIAQPPKWAFGPWMSANGWNSQAKAEAAVRRSLAEDVPVTVLVLEAWSDESTFYIFNDATYEAKDGKDRLELADFTFGGRWTDPKKMIDEFHDAGVRVLLWQIPVQKKLEEAHAQHDADEAYMLEQTFMIQNGDGSPYRNVGWWFTDALVLDVTNPDARDWWFSKRQYLFDELGIDGMKTDGGEHLWGRDLKSHGGQRGVELVNRYAQAYVDAYHDYVQKMTGGDGLTFSRAGYTGAQRSPAHWAGDENSTWGALRASIQAGLSAGLAGISIWGWDIGGFAGDIPTVELYLRSTQMAAFCPVMQYHSELHGAVECRDRTPWNIAERTGDERALTIYRAYAKLRMRLLDYIADESAALAKEGQPLMRYPGLVYPEARAFLMADPYSYLFGRDLLICPVLEKGAQTREVRLPPGRWVDFWSGAEFEGDRVVVVPAPLERIPVFIDAKSPWLETLRDIATTFEVA